MNHNRCAIFGALLVLALPACVVLQTSKSAPLNIDVIMSSYLGGGTEDTAVEALTVAMDNSGTVFVGGKGGFNFGLTPVILDRGGDGFVLVLSNGGRNFNKIYRYGTEVNRLVIREKGDNRRILIQSDKGLVLFNQDFDHVLWNKPMACQRDMCYSDLGTDGTVAVVLAPEEGVQGSPVFTVQSFAVDGSTIGSVADPEKIGDVLTDVAVDPLHKQILIASYYESPNRRIPCVIALDYTAQTEQWHNYCVSEEELVQTQNTASCWINRIHYSDFDDRLYMAANTHGGNNVLRYNPLDIRNAQGSLHGLSHSAVPGWDMYTETSGMHGAHEISFVARYNPADGSMEVARYFLTRYRAPTTSVPRGNNLRNEDISSGPDGTVVVAQDANNFIQNRDNLTINNMPLATYTGPYEAVLLGLTPQLDRRLVWHHFAKNNGSSNAVAVAANQFNSHTRIAFVAFSNENEFLTVNELPGTGRATSSIEQYVLIVLELPSVSS